MTLKLDRDVKIPTDTSAAIHTDGLLGSKYIVLDPGVEEEYLGNGDKFDLTQDSVVVQDLLELIIGETEANQAKRKK